MLRRLGWGGEGAGLGAGTGGIAEPVKAGEIRTGDAKYLGVGHGENGEEGGDVFDRFRKQRSYTFNKEQGREKREREREVAACFRCGKVSMSEIAVRGCWVLVEK